MCECLPVTNITEYSPDDLSLPTVKLNNIAGVALGLCLYQPIDIVAFACLIAHTVAWFIAFIFQGIHVRRGISSSTSSSSSSSTPSLSLHSLLHLRAFCLFLLISELLLLFMMLFTSWAPGWWGFHLTRLMGWILILLVVIRRIRALRARDNDGFAPALISPLLASNFLASEHETTVETTTNHSTNSIATTINTHIPQQMGSYNTSVESGHSNYQGGDRSPRSRLPPSQQHLVKAYSPKSISPSSSPLLTRKLNPSSSSSAAYTGINLNEVNDRLSGEYYPPMLSQGQPADRRRLSLSSQSNQTQHSSPHTSGSQYPATILRMPEEQSESAENLQTKNTTKLYSMFGIMALTVTFVTLQPLFSSLEWTQSHSSPSASQHHSSTSRVLLSVMDSRDTSPSSISPASVSHIGPSTKGFGHSLCNEPTTTSPSLDIMIGLISWVSVLLVGFAITVTAVMLKERIRYASFSRTDSAKLNSQNQSGLCIYSVTFILISSIFFVLGVTLQDRNDLFHNPYITQVKSDGTVKHKKAFLTTQVLPLVAHEGMLLVGCAIILYQLYKLRRVH